MELWDVYDENRQKKGYTLRRGIDSFKENEYHLVVHIWIINDNNEFLIQRRSLDKNEGDQSYASTGGSVVSGEDSLTSAIRETYEEIGVLLKEEELKHIFSYAPRKNYKAFTDVYLVRKDINLNECILDPKEVWELMYCTLDELLEMRKNNRFWKYDELYEPYFQILKEKSGI